MRGAARCAFSMRTLHAAVPCASAWQQDSLLATDLCGSFSFTSMAYRPIAERLAEDVPPLPAFGTALAVPHLAPHHGCCGKFDTLVVLAYA